MMYILGMNNTHDVATGEIWKLGNPILMCGSSLLSDDVNELFGDRVAEMSFTSPPYSDQRDYKQGHNNLSPESIAKVIPIYKDHTRFQCVNLGYKFTKFSIDTYWNYYINEALGCGLKLLAWNIWDKNGCIGIGAQTKMFPHDARVHFRVRRTAEEAQSHCPQETQDRPEPFPYNQDGLQGYLGQTLSWRHDANS